MTRDEARQWLPILQAYADGKQIQSDVIPAGWADVYSVNTAKSACRYRIKPEPVLRPWTEAEIEAECIKGTVIRYKNPSVPPVIGAISINGSQVCCGSHRLRSASDATWLMENCVIAATGDPCGVME